MLWLVAVVCLQQRGLIAEVSGLGICGHWTQVGTVGNGDTMIGPGGVEEDSP